MSTIIKMTRGKKQSAKVFRRLIKWLKGMSKFGSCGLRAYAFSKE